MVRLKIILIVLGMLVLVSVGLLENNKVQGVVTCPDGKIWSGTGPCTGMDDYYNNQPKTEKIIEPEKSEPIEIKQEPFKPDPIKKHGINRNHNLFKMYCKGQELIGIQYFNSSIIQNEIPPSFTIYFTILQRSEDPVLQANVLIEKQRSEKLYFDLFGNYSRWFD